MKADPQIPSQAIPVKGCPFCGKRPDITVYIAVPKDGARLTHDCELIGYICSDWSNYADLVNRWNKRHKQVTPLTAKRPVIGI